MEAVAVSLATLDSGTLDGISNMAIDEKNLQNIQPSSGLQLRFFQWKDPTVSYGYLMDAKKVTEWAHELKALQIVQRPTGGGVVYHNHTDLSMSLLWPRYQQILPEKPRDCYEDIHESISSALKPFYSTPLTLYVKPTGDCRQNTVDVNDQRHGRFSLCYDEPVCNDIMAGKKKVVGGALRITRKAILYQGNILLDSKADLNGIKEAIKNSF